MVTIIAGARPNFIKIAPIIKSFQTKQIPYRFVHIGQHYDVKMSQTFFEELNIPSPDVNLACGGGSHAEQTAAIMVAFEKDLEKNPTDLVLVVGDVTSTMACSIVAKKQGVRVAHVEAGIRSFDMSMPEEINRMVTDVLCDYYFTTSHVANENLLKSGIDSSNIFFVGNVMIDTLLSNQSRFRKPIFWEDYRLGDKSYFILTLHRPANVDKEENLRELLQEIVNSARDLPIIFPIHPRTAKIYHNLNLDAPNLKIVEPIGYLEFNYLVEHSKGVITDSGGITEETTMMNVPCMTLRDNTERPETCTIGTNELIGTNPQNIKPAMDKIFNGEWKKGSVPELWDGETSDRIAQILSSIL